MSRLARCRRGFLGHSAKNRESGIWLKICKIIVIPETEILHSRSLPIFPDWELSGIIGNNRVPIIPDNSRSPNYLPNYSRLFPIFPDASGLVKNFCLACLARLFRPALLVLHCRAHVLLLTIAKVNIVTTSLKVT